jgi:probable phosphoglycerate mutase
MPRRATRLFLVRHAEALANTEMRYLGSRDDPLTVRGREQAAQLAEALAGLPFGAVYSSPRERAAATAGPIAATLGLAVRTEPRLREADFGAWEGATRAEVLARGDADRERLERWERDADAAPPGGEALRDVERRMLELLGELGTRHPGQWLVVVSHVSPIKAALAAALDAPLESARRLFLDPATISVVDWGEPPLVRLFNHHGHLGWRAARWIESGGP